MNNFGGSTDLVAAESKTFWKPMTRNTIFVAADNPAKRKELEENVIKAFYLSNLSAITRALYAETGDLWLLGRPS
jgi:hypothetical protein